MSHIDDPATLTVKTTAGMQRIVLDALAEVERSIEIHGDQRGRPLGTDPMRYRGAADAARLTVNHGTASDPATWVQIISEEMHEAFAEATPERARVELVQVLAVVMKAIDSIDAEAANVVRPTPLTVFGARA